MQLLDHNRWMHFEARLVTAEECIDKQDPGTWWIASRNAGYQVDVADEGLGQLGDDAAAQGTDAQRPQDSGRIVRRRRPERGRA